MKTLKIDDKWSIEYDETQNDRPVNLLRHGEAAGPALDWDNPKTAMFYALLAHEEAAADTRRLTRELDVAMHGEAGAAEQASLCDLIPAAKHLRDEIAMRTNTFEALMKDAHPLITVDTSVQKTLRDEIAIAAMSALIIANGGDVCTLRLGNAKDAYEAADAMLKAREAV